MGRSADGNGPKQRTKGSRKTQSKRSMEVDAVGKVPKRSGTGDTENIEKSEGIQNLV